MYIKKKKKIHLHALNTPDIASLRWAQWLLGTVDFKFRAMTEGHFVYTHEILYIKVHSYTR